MEMRILEEKEKIIKALKKEKNGEWRFVKAKKKLTSVQIWFGVVGVDWLNVRIVETEFSEPFIRLLWWHEVRHPEKK